MDNEIPETEIVQFPAILKDGDVLVAGPGINMLDRAELKGMAELMGGVVGFIKMRATYTTLETLLCTAYECYRPVDDKMRCTSHPIKGK